MSSDDDLVALFPWESNWNHHGVQQWKPPYCYCLQLGFHPGLYRAKAAPVRVKSLPLPHLVSVGQEFQKSILLVCSSCLTWKAKCMPCVGSISISTNNVHVLTLLYPFSCLDALTWLLCPPQPMSGGLHVHEGRPEPQLRLHKL